MAGFGRVITGSARNSACINRQTLSKDKMPLSSFEEEESGYGDDTGAFARALAPAGLSENREALDWPLRAGYNGN